MRNPKQIRLETAFHEAGHVVAGFLFGRRIERAWVLSELALSDPASLTDADDLGRVLFEGRPNASLSEAIDDIVLTFAGMAAARMAWASGLVTDEQIGVTQVIATEELSVDELLAVSNGQTPVAQAVAHGFYEMPANGDAATARAIAEQWTSDPLECAALLGFCERRTSNLTMTERFQRMVGYFAVVLEEHGEMEGSLVHHLLEREDEVHQQGATAPEGGTA